MVHFIYILNICNAPLIPRRIGQLSFCTFALAVFSTLSKNHIIVGVNASLIHIVSHIVIPICYHFWISNGLYYKRGVGHLSQVVV